VLAIYTKYMNAMIAIYTINKNSVLSKKTRTRKKPDRRRENLRIADYPD
jgi:hypothetical protein